ncbi:MAG: ComEA family DNA-binding protein [Myxococcota bacterium]
MAPQVPETHLARAAVWGALLAAALGFSIAPAAPGRIALVADTGQCRLDSALAGLPACDCARTPLALREVLGLPAPLNSLTGQELERTPGFGPVRAAAIARERTARGPFHSLDELAARVPGIGAKTVDRIRPRYFVAGPDPACGGSRGE